ncbi:hypothetical protein [Candidatus Pantoea soli]|uniref:hypothetical protein n=1 Tax=Candidatus Pantoea soli TaxID=3098669 RepID=UPI00119D1E76|nr:hypothetical protein [Pantoea soli]
MNRPARIGALASAWFSDTGIVFLQKEHYGAVRALRTDAESITKTRAQVTQSFATGFYASLSDQVAHCQAFTESSQNFARAIDVPEANHHYPGLNELLTPERKGVGTQ